MATQSLLYWGPQSGGRLAQRLGQRCLGGAEAAADTWRAPAHTPRTDAPFRLRRRAVPGVGSRAPPLRPVASIVTPPPGICPCTMTVWSPHATKGGPRSIPHNAPHNRAEANHANEPAHPRRHRELIRSRTGLWRIRVRRGGANPLLPTRTALAVAQQTPAVLGRVPEIYNERVRGLVSGVNAPAADAGERAGDGGSARAVPTGPWAGPWLSTKGLGPSNRCAHAVPASRCAVKFHYATSAWQGNWFSVGIGPVSKATQ